jgi:hypothetical protein
MRLREKCLSIVCARLNKLHIFHIYVNQNLDNGGIHILLNSIYLIHGYENNNLYYYVLQYITF